MSALDRNIAIPDVDWRVAGSAAKLASVYALSFMSPSGTRYSERYIVPFKHLRTLLATCQCFCVGFEQWRANWFTLWQISGHVQLINDLYISGSNSGLGKSSVLYSSPMDFFIIFCSFALLHNIFLEQLHNFLALGQFVPILYFSNF